MRTRTGPAAASASQHTATRPTPASHRLTSFAASTRHRWPSWVSRFFMVRPDHSPPTWAPASSASASAPGSEAISPAASAPAASGSSCAATWAGWAPTWATLARSRALARVHCCPAWIPSSAHEGRWPTGVPPSRAALWAPPTASSTQNTAAAAATPQVSGRPSLISSAPSSRIVGLPRLGQLQERLFQPGALGQDLAGPYPAPAEHLVDLPARRRFDQHRIGTVGAGGPAAQQRQRSGLVGRVDHQPETRPGRCQLADRPLFDQPPGVDHRNLVAHLPDLGELMA